MTDSKSQSPPRNSNTVSSSSHLAPPPPYSEDIERGVNEASPLYPGRLLFFLSSHISFIILFYSKSRSLHSSKRNHRVSPWLFLTRLSSLQKPAYLALIKQHQRRHLGASRYFFILQFLIVIRSKTLRTLLVFSILAIVLTLHLHENTKHRLILDSLTWTELTPSIGCLRYSTREYSALLRGVPNEEDALQWCKEKDIIIRGIDFKKPAHYTIDVDKSVRKPSFSDTRLTDLYLGDHQGLRPLDRQVE